MPDTNGLEPSTPDELRAELEWLREQKRDAELHIQTVYGLIERAATSSYRRRFGQPVKPRPIPGANRALLRTSPSARHG
jgi:hypothetical protein